MVRNPAGVTRSNGLLDGAGRKFLALAGVLFLSLALSACGGDDTPSPAPTAVSDAGAGEAERLFVLDTGKLYEIIGDERVLFAEAPPESSIYDAAVSPDGTDVALSVQPKPTQNGTTYDFGIDLLVSHDGEDPFVVAAHEKIGESMSHPNWLPDGERLIFMVLGRDETGGTDLHIDYVDLGTGVRERYVDNAIEPSLSNDGNTLAYVSYDIATASEVITLADLATGEQRALLPAGTVMTNVGNIAWAPDDTRLVFAASDPLSLTGGAVRGGTTVVHPSLRDIWLVNLDGSGLHRLTDLADSTLSLAWSADDRHVYALGDTGFWRVDTTNGELEPIGPPVLAGVVQTLLP